jgi:perosamine synthetase
MGDVTTADFIDAVRSVTGDEPVIQLHEPEIGDVEKAYVLESLDSGFVSSVGEFVTRFETEIAAFTGAKSAVVVSNGTSALHIALVLAGVRAGDEVLIPALSFIATANAVVHAGARPHFIDSNAVTLGLDVNALDVAIGRLVPRDGVLVNPDTGARVSAIVPMHTFGHPAEIEAIVELADRHGIAVVEDAAESLGSYVGDRHTGTFGRLGVLSFNGNKTLTTGGGGMILTDDVELGREAKHLTTTAKLPHPWEFEHDEVAWNYRMPNLNAALGVAQFTRLPGFLTEKRTLARRYTEAFDAVEGMTFLAEPAGTTSNYWLNAVRLDVPDLELRDHLLRAANDSGLKVRPFWNLLSEQRMYTDNPRGDLSVAHELLASTICLPSSPKLARWR